MRFEHAVPDGLQVQGEPNPDVNYEQQRFCEQGGIDLPPLGVQHTLFPFYE